MEGLKWDRGTSKPKQGSQFRKEAINVEGGTQGVWGVGDSKYHNPAPLCRLTGPKNEVEVIVNNEQVTTLVGSAAQISAVSMVFAKHHNLPFWQLQQRLDFEGSGGIDIPYIGCKFSYKFWVLKIITKIFWCSFKKIVVIQNVFQ